MLYAVTMWYLIIGLALASLSLIIAPKDEMAKVATALRSIKASQGFVLVVLLIFAAVAWPMYVYLGIKDCSGKKKC